MNPNIYSSDRFKVSQDEHEDFDYCDCGCLQPTDDWEFADPENYPEGKYIECPNCGRIIEL